MNLLLREATKTLLTAVVTTFATVLATKAAEHVWQKLEGDEETKSDEQGEEQ